MASRSVTAGSLVWDVGVSKQEDALRKVETLGRKLDEALNKPRSTPSSVQRTGEAAAAATTQVERLANQFARLKAEYELGQISNTEYRNGLSQLQTMLQATARSTDQNSREFRTLGTTMGQATRELNKLSREQAGAAREANKLATEQRRVADREVRDRVQSLVNEVRVLRNEWQETGEGTQETKDRLRDLMVEMSSMRTELREGEDGWERYNAEIARLATAGRSAEATIMGMEGKMSRLGLASQVNLGVFGALQGQMSRFGLAGQLAGQQLGIVAGGFQGLNRITPGTAIGIAAVGTAASALIRKGIPEVKEMQSALRILVASGEDLTQAQLDEELRRIQESAGLAGQQFRRAEIATALAEIVKAGVDAADAMHLLEPGMQLANVTGQSLNETTLLLLGNLRQFGLDTTEAARVADALAEADLAAAEGAKELSEGLAIVGPVAAAAGFELEEVLGILVELDNKGMSAANVGATALRAAFSALLDPTAKARDTLARLGVELNDGQGRRRPLPEVLRDVRDALQGSSEAAIIAAEIFDTRAITAIINMSDASDELADSFRNSTGALGEYSDTVTDESLQKAQQALNTALSDLALTFAGTFAGNIIAATNAISEWFRQIDRGMKSESFIQLLAALDPSYEGWENMSFGERFGTIMGGSLAPSRGPAFGSDLESLQQRAAAAAAEVERLEQVQESFQYKWVYGIQARLQTDRELAAARAELAEATRLVTAAEQDAIGLTGSPTDGGGASGPVPTGTVGPSMDALIAQARVLKTELDAASDPQSWIRASQAVEDFKTSSEDAALAWQAVVATLGGSTKATKPERTVDDIFKDLEKGGITAQRAAQALGDTLDAQLQSVQTRSRLVNAAIAELMARPDVNQGDNPNRLAYLLNLSEALEASATRLERQIATLAAGTGGIAGLADGDMTIAGVTIPSGTPDPADAARRQAMLANWREGQEAVEGYAEALAEVETRLKLGLISGEEAAQERLAVTNRFLSAMPAMYDTLTDSQREYVQQVIDDARRMQRELDELERQAARQEARSASLARVQDQDGPSSITSVFRTPAELRAWVERQREAARELEEAARSAARRSGMAVVASLRDDAALRLQARKLGRDITQGIADSSLEGLQELEQQLITIIEGLGDDPAAAPFMGLLLQVRVGMAAVSAEMETAARELAQKQRRILEIVARDELQGAYRNLGIQATQALREGSITALQELEQQVIDMLDELGDDPNAAPLMGVLTQIREGIRNLVTAEELNTIEGLQRRIIALRNEGFEPTSDAVQELVRRINELQLRAALEELRTKGAKNISAFARSILELNGVMPKANAEAKTFVDHLRGLGGNDIADGLADVLDGIDLIANSAGDAEVAVEGLTKVLQGATQLVEALGSGDAFEVMKNIGMIAGEGIGQAMGIPGVGQAVGALFDLGRVIVETISDAFTGDSPAARAIRDGLTSAVQSAFTTGILAALQQGDNWRENLRDGVRLAFLTGLIEAFVKSAIITAIIEPILYEYSKMLAKGQYDAAAEFLAGALPAAISRATQEVERFVSSVPPGLIPSAGGGGPKPPEQGPTGLFELTTATVTGIAAPDWARDLVNAGRVQLQASEQFAAAVALLVSEGIRVNNTSGAAGAGGGSSAAAARAI